jgi:hypothetical protein
MEEIITKRIKAAGIPKLEISRSQIKGYDTRYVKAFIKSRENVVVVGEQYYEICIRMMRLMLQSDISMDIRWLAQSQLKNLNLSEVYYNCASLVGLYEEPAAGWKGLTGSFLNQVLSIGGNLLIGVKTIEQLELAFPYDSDRIEKEFVIWSI